MSNSMKDGVIAAPCNLMSRGVVIDTKHLTRVNGTGSPPRGMALGGNAGEVETPEPLRAHVKLNERRRDRRTMQSYVTRSRHRHQTLDTRQWHWVTTARDGAGGKCWGGRDTRTPPSSCQTQ